MEEWSSGHCPILPPTRKGCPRTGLCQGTYPSFNQHLLSTYCMPSGATAENLKKKTFAFMQFTFYEEDKQEKLVKKF